MTPRKSRLFLLITLLHGGHDQPNKHTDRNQHQRDDQRDFLHVAGRDRLVRVHRRRLVTPKYALSSVTRSSWACLKLLRPLRVVDAEHVLMPEDAFLPTIGPNEVDVLADKLAHWRAQQAGAE
ncbi:hypothetical protein [Pseudomonas aeruginosa]|uniref:hypothetical protein n=1 Tax=Pseudomonas aeruginosa TaxID=287 RepID=UPI0035C6619E